LEFNQKLFLYLLYQLLHRVQSKLIATLLCTIAALPIFHKNSLHNLIQSETILSQVLLIPPDLHHQITQTLQILFLIQLLGLHLLLYQRLGECRVGVQQGQQELADCPLGEEEVVVGQNRRLVDLQEMLIICCQLRVDLFVFGAQLLDLCS
jgi:hypothetical protein